MHIRVAHISEQQSYFTNFAPMHFVVEVKFRTMFRNVLLACLFVQVAKAAKGWLDWLIAMHTAHGKCKYRSPKRSAHFLEYTCCGLGSLVNTWLFQMLYVLGRFSLFQYRHMLWLCTHVCMWMYGPQNLVRRKFAARYEIQRTSP